MRPKGVLIAIGGNETKVFKRDERYQPRFGEGEPILRRVLHHCGGEQARLEVVTSASKIPIEVGENYKKAFSALGAENIGIMDIRSREDAEQPEFLKRLRETDGIMFSGGDQSRISRFFKDTEFCEILGERYRNENFMIAGTSAGAMMMSHEMIAGGKHHKTLKRGGLRMGKGLGLMPDVIFDSHFIQRGRFGRLAEAVSLHPEKLGIGLGEDTGMLIREGNVCQVIGTGMVILFDGSDFAYNRCFDLKKDMPISLANLTVHILASNDKYTIDEDQIEVFHNADSYHEEVQ